VALEENGRWVFAAGGGDSEGFNDAALDTFQGHGVQSLVREIIQNSADARADEGSPTRVAFSIFKIPASEAPEVTALAPWLKRAWDADPLKPNEDDEVSLKRHDFYRDGIGSLTKPSLIMLAVHDYNTTGLTGRTSYSATEESGPWWALVRSTGRNQKNNAGAGGSFGHGSKAPIAYSAVRTVFYYTEFVENGSTIQRFQGKSILESMEHPNSKNQFTSNTGYFGQGDSEHNPLPLTGPAVPGWAKSDRQRFQAGSGTSVFIPLPQFESEQDFWDQAKTAVVGNFAPAILEGEIVVDLGGETVVNQDSIKKIFTQLDRESLDDEAIDRLESAETVLFGERHRDDWDGIGRVDYFFRKGDPLRTRRVGIARSLGMLVTRKAERLGPSAQYGGTEPFDLFVWVRGGEGNQLLRSLENPEHNAFEFDRIKNREKNKIARAKFSAFVKQVRELIQSRFGIRIDEQLPLSDLDFLLDGFSLGEDGQPGDSGVDTPAISPIQKPVSPGPALKPKKKAAGKAAAMRGRKPPRGIRGVLDADGDNVEKNELLAEGFRVVPTEGNASRATIFIDVPRPEYRFLQVFRAGETVVDDKPCRIKVTHSAGSIADRVPLPEPGKSQRISLSLDFEDGEDLHGGSRLVGVLR
jgi:hypothetical protein